MGPGADPQTAAQIVGPLAEPLEGASAAVGEGGGLVLLGKAGQLGQFGEHRLQGGGQLHPVRGLLDLMRGGTRLGQGVQPGEMPGEDPKQRAAGGGGPAWALRDDEQALVHAPAVVVLAEELEEVAGPARGARWARASGWERRGGRPCAWAGRSHARVGTGSG